jgi:iron complex transport system substrate-binding protein
MVYALGAGGKLVAVTDYCDYPVNVTERKANGTLSSVGAYATPNFDKIVAAQSDIVILIKDASGHVALAAQLDEAHIQNVMIYECTDLTKIYNNVQMLGKILHAQSVAEEYVQEMKVKVQYIESHVGVQVEKPSVMFCVYISSTGLTIAGNGTYISDVIRVAGGNNTFSALNGYKKVSSEGVINANDQEGPDVIIVTATMMANVDRNATQIRDSIMNDPTLMQTNAVRNGKVFILMHESENVFLRAGVRITDGGSLIARMLYPDNFGGALPVIIDGPYQSYLPSYNSG